MAHTLKQTTYYADIRREKTGDPRCTTEEHKAEPPSKANEKGTADAGGEGEYEQCDQRRNAAPEIELKTSLAGVRGGDECQRKRSEERRVGKECRL